MTDNNREQLERLLNAINEGKLKSSEAKYSNRWLIVSIIGLLIVFLWLFNAKGSISELLSNPITGLLAIPGVLGLFWIYKKLFSNDDNEKIQKLNRLLTNDNLKNLENLLSGNNAGNTGDQLQRLLNIINGGNTNNTTTNNIANGNLPTISTNPITIFFRWLLNKWYLIILCSGLIALYWTYKALNEAGVIDKAEIAIMQTLTDSTNMTKHCLPLLTKKNSTNRIKNFFYCLQHIERYRECDAETDDIVIHLKDLQRKLQNLTTPKPFSEQSDPYDN